MKVDFSWQIFKKYSDINLMKICPVGAKFYVVRQRNMMKLVIAFCNPANTLKIR